MRKPVFLGSDPSIGPLDYSDAVTLFEKTGGNTGNLAFLGAVRMHLGAEAAIRPLGAPVRDVRAAGDIIVMPLANQLGAHTDLSDWADWLDQYDLPVLGIGLGAQARKQGDPIRLSPGTGRWLATMARLSPGQGPNLGARGVFTAEQIGRAGYPGATAVIGCPSNFISIADPAAALAAARRRKPKRIAVTAGIPFLPALARIERMLVGLVTEPRSYIVQHGLEMIRLACNAFDLIAPHELDLTHDYVMPGRDLETFKDWCRIHAVVLHDVQGWMAHLRTFDFVVGTRFHGVMLALQAGVPAGCITHDSRTEEMCQTMAVPYCSYRSIDTLSHDNVLDHFRFDADAYRATRRILLERYLRMYADADLEIGDHLRAVSRAA